VSDAATILPISRPAPTCLRALILGERIDTRGLERQDSLGTAPLMLRLAEGGAAVLFRYGVVVLLDATEEGENALLARIEPLVVDPLGSRDTDEARITVSRDAEEQVDASGAVVLKEASVPRLQLVAEMLARSLILSHYEARVRQIFDRIEPLAGSLRARGRVGAHGRELLRQIGDVLLMQHKMVGRVETRETPELLWDHPDLERLYLRLAEEYELRERDRALDRKLDVIWRTVETFLGLVQNRSSIRVEWYILGLIVAELALSFYPILLAR